MSPAEERAHLVAAVAAMHREGLTDYATALLEEGARRGIPGAGLALATAASGDWREAMAHLEEESP